MLNVIFLAIISTGIIYGTEAQCNSSQFECNNGNCIDLNNLCDFVDDCGDRSDEQRYVTGFKCPVGRKGHICVLPQRLVNDSIGHCADDADLCEVDGINRCHKCLTTGMVLAFNQLCDGVVDCPDTSDECLCETTVANQLCNKLMPGQMMRCDNSTRIPINEICDGKLDCDDASDERFCRSNFLRKEIFKCPNNLSNITKLAVPCDGNPECDDFSDECDGRCSEEPSFCSLLINDSMTTCSAEGRANFTLSSRDVCDGLVSNCSGSFEDERNCSSRFYCASNGRVLFSIDSSLVCNGNPDCNDASDEANCSSRHLCEVGQPVSVPLSFIMDGKRDCMDGSDECPAFLDEKLFASREHLSSRLEITIWLWIMAIVGLLGNILVFSYTLRKLLSRGTMSSTAKTNFILILNLNVADFLTAVYLLFLGAKNAEYSGIYCDVDLRWRTSFACSFMGSLSVFSAEASLLLLTLMTTQRLYSVYDPIGAGFHRRRWIFLGIATVWCVAFFIAAIPSFLPQIFVERYWIESKYFNTALVRLPAFDNFLQKLVFISEPVNFTSITPKFDFRKYLSANYPQFAILGDFGYYSENSVCIPHFYVPYGDNGWFYPTTIVTVNLIAFIYVAIAYYIIYRLSTKKNLRTNQNNSHARHMQKRLAKLVAVNFAVWLPICIASYVQLGIPEEFSDALFVITAVVLFPINSIMNPLLYSDVFERVYKKLRKRIKKQYQITQRDNTSTNPTSSAQQETAETKA